MKKAVFLAALLAFAGLMMPTTARANGIDLTNQYGTVTITNAGVVSHGSELYSFNGITAFPGHSLGSVSFSTGALSSGDIWSGGTFSSAGSSFIITGAGRYGQPRGVIFNGSFVGPIDWTVIGKSGKYFVEYQLSGKIQGLLWTGRYVSGTTTQTIYTYKNQEIVDHKGNISLGSTHFATPEPGTLGMLGTGLVTIAGIFRRKLGKG